MTTKDLLFETSLPLPEKQVFPIKIANAQEFPASIKSYNDKISNFNYNESINKISYDIIYNWNENKHDSSINQIVLLEKDFLGFKQGYYVDVLIDDIQIQDDYFYFDISNPDKNIIGIKIPHEELMEIKNKINDKNDGEATKIEILSGKN